MEQLIGKAIADPDFRQQLVDDPQAAAQSAGIDLSSDELQALQNTSREERQQMMEQLGERTSPWFDGISVTWI
jgi:acyl-CoA hydrolase